MFDLGQKFDFKKFSTLIIDSFLIEVTFLCQMRTFPRNLNHHGKCREQKENFQTILVNILELYNILIQIRFTTNKRKLDI